MRSAILFALTFGLVVAESSSVVSKSSSSTSPAESATISVPAARRCGTAFEHASAGLLNTIQQLNANQQRLSGSVAARAATAVKSKQTIFVDLYMHVVSTVANSKLITPAMAQSQFAVLNQAYMPAGIQFQLRNTSWTVNDDWATGSSSDSDSQMKTALRQGSYDSLNLYFQTDLAGGVLGQCTLPTSIGPNADPTTYSFDGCNIAAGTMPQGPIYGYNMGMTSVHETGHWLGLLHTFEGYSCQGNGDMIADTPQESQSTNGCPSKPAKNTCPGSSGSNKGNDPIHNYMDYSTDACYERFTTGQINRMRQLWPQYRQGN